MGGGRGGEARPPYLDTFEGVRPEDLGAWLALEMLSGPVRWGAFQARTGVKGGNTVLPNTDKTLEKELKTLDDDNWKCLGGS